MEREYLQRHERRLELVKTVSLRQLFDDKVEPQVGIDNWTSALQQLQDRGTLEFKLTQLLFDRDHPGHYCRQGGSVEVDLPVLTGPYENVRASLLQISSMIATQASSQSVRYLHNPDGATGPSDVQVNLRSGQQIVLSMGITDNGMTAMKPDEGLLNPFENTGAVSRWTLNFPRPTKASQHAMLLSLTDIILRIRFTAQSRQADLRANRRRPGDPSRKPWSRTQPSKEPSVMNEPIIQANESLIRNGGFEQGFTDWKKGPINPSWLSEASEVHEGVIGLFLKAGNRSSVSQSLRVPKNPGAQARYVLGFWCETRHIDAGTLKISIDGQQETLVIPLPPGASRDIGEDQARLRNGQPLEFKPIKYKVELVALPFSAGDTLTVDVSSPANAPNDPISGICITQINLQLHLEPAVMQGLMLDEEPVSPAATLYMCLGPSCESCSPVEILLAPDNAWQDTHAALTSDDNPLDAIVASPDWGMNHPLEDQWQLDCPLIGEEGPYLFSMNLLNQYTAEPYPVNVARASSGGVPRRVRGSVLPGARIRAGCTSGRSSGVVLHRPSPQRANGDLDT